MQKIAISLILTCDEAFFIDSFGTFSVKFLYRDTVLCYVAKRFRSYHYAFSLFVGVHFYVVFFCRFNCDLLTETVFKVDLVSAWRFYMAFFYFDSKTESFFNNFSFADCKQCL